MGNVRVEQCQLLAEYTLAWVCVWWPVLISGFSAYARQWQNMATGVQSLRISLRIHHNDKASRQSGMCFNRL